MNIDSYTFGKISVDGKPYTSDVIIYPDHVKSPWWRKAGHNLETADLAELLEAPPAVLVIGTGFYGRMQVPAETREALQACGIEIHIGTTTEAVTELNRLARECADVVAALHLTC
jgi:hypothetical protein